MTAYHRLAVAAVLLTAAAPAARAADPAELFPPSTLAYAEVRDLGTAGPELAALLRGTVFEDVVTYVHNRRDKSTEPRDLFGKDELAVLGLLAAPEMQAELKRLGGVGVGLTGFSDRGEPRGAVAILTGESAAAGLIGRAVLAMSSVRRVGDVEGVPIFQHHTPGFTYDNNGQQRLSNEKPPPAATDKLTLAYLPGLFVMATDRAVVGEVVRRFEKRSTDSLAGTAGFQEAAKRHRQPGVFGYAAAEPFCAAYAGALKAAGSGVEPDALGWAKLLANVKAVKYVAVTARARDGGLAVTAAVGFDPSKPSPLLAALGGPPATADLLHHAPSPAAGAIGFHLPEKNRAAALVGLMNAVAVSAGQVGRSPGETVKELEKKYQTPVTDEVLGRTRGVTVVFPPPPPPKEGAPPPKDGLVLPTLVLHTDTPEAAAGWADLVPKLAGDLAKTPPPQPAAETVNGVRVLSLPAAGVPWKAPLHFGHKDNRFAVGLDRATVAAAVTGAAAASVIGVGKPAFPPGDGAAALATATPAGFLRALDVLTKSDSPATAPKSAPGGRRFQRFNQFGQPIEDDQPDAKQLDDEKRMWAAMVKAAEPMGPTGVAVRRVGDELRVEVWQPKVRTGGLVPVMNAAANYIDTRLNRTPMSNGNMMYFR